VVLERCGGDFGAVGGGYITREDAGLDYIATQ